MTDATPNDEEAPPPVGADSKRATDPHDDARAALAGAARAFAVGDHAAVRELVRPLTEHPDADVAREALSWLGKVSIDPAQWVVLGLSLAFFVAVTWHYVF